MKRILAFGLALAMLALWSMPAAAQVYTATANGNNGTVTIEAAIEDGVIQAIEITDSNETAGLGDTAMEQLIGEIISGQTLALDAVSGATNSSNALFTAVADCAEQAGMDVEALKAVPAGVPSEATAA